MLTELSNEMADAVATAAPSVVQVHGRRRPATGLVYGAAVVLTTVRAIGGGDGATVRRGDGERLDAELAGWDPANGLAVLNVPGLDLPAIPVARTAARVGHLGIAIARSWSNALTASAGVVATIGGPLPTGRRHSIEEVIRTTAPMHDGFSGGAFADTTGALIGVTTAMSIRGSTVVIPAGIAWRSAAAILEHGHLKRGYLGIAGQPVTLPDHQRVPDAGHQALLVVQVTDGSPAAQAGLLVGDLLLAIDGHTIRSPEDLLDRLTEEVVGRTVAVRVSRAGAVADLQVRVGERPGR